MKKEIPVRMRETEEVNRLGDKEKKPEMVKNPREKERIRNTETQIGV